MTALTPAPDQLLAVIDSETTGLDPSRDLACILEVYVSIRDMQLNELASFHRDVRPYCRPGVSWGDICEAPIVLEMHTKSGLLSRCDASGSKLDDVREDLKQFLADHNGGDPKSLMLVGNSLSGVDLPFFRALMPEVLSEVHYRHLDVTALRYGTYVAFGKDHVLDKKRHHTAAADVEECLDELKFIANNVYADIWERACVQFANHIYEWAKEQGITPPALALHADLPFPELAAKSFEADR